MQSDPQLSFSDFHLKCADSKRRVMSLFFPSDINIVMRCGSQWFYSSSLRLAYILTTHLKPQLLSSVTRGTPSYRFLPFINFLLSSLSYVCLSVYTSASVARNTQCFTTQFDEECLTWIFFRQALFWHCTRPLFSFLVQVGQNKAALRARRKDKTMNITSHKISSAWEQRQRKSYLHWFLPV